MKLISKGDLFFLAFIVIVLIAFSNFDANFSTYVWFLFAAAAMWMARRAQRLVRFKTVLLEEELQKEKNERIQAVKQLNEVIEELRTAIKPTGPVSATPAPKVSPAAAGVPPIGPATTVPQSAPPAAAFASPSFGAKPPEKTSPEPTLPALKPIPEPFQERSQNGVEVPSRDWAATIRRLLDFEQMLGTNWLSKLGVAVLVLGIAFFLAWQLRELGPPGKIAVGVVVSAVLLAVGIWGERFERYRLLARAALAGGWPLLFFVVYAAHHIAAAHVISSPLLALVLMFAVVVAMVGHTLRFRSQVVTGMAFLLAFSTVAFNRVDVYSLSANVILAVGLCFVSVRMQWFELEIFGILAAYLNHYAWLQPVIEPMHGKVHPFPQFYASAGILLLYWAVFRASYVIRPPVNERLSAVAGVLNTVLLLTVMRYQSVHPELAFWALLALGTVELALGQIVKFRNKRTCFIVLSTLGTALLLAAIPFRYTADYVSPIWLIEAELLFFLGIFINERVFRILGNLAAAATALQLFAVHAARVYGERMDNLYVVHHWMLGAIFMTAMLALYANANWAPRKWPQLFDQPIDHRIATYLTYTAGLTGTVGAWVMFPRAGAAVLWMALAVVLAWVGSRFETAQLIVQSNLLAAAAVLRSLVMNLPSGDLIKASQPISYRLTTVSAIAAMGYLLSRWNRSTGLRLTERLPQIATWTASMLISLLVWYEMRPINVAAGWTMLGLILFEIADARRSRNLRLQAYAAFGAGFLRMFIVNLNADRPGAAIGPRLYTMVPIAIALLYVHQRLRTMKSEAGEAEQKLNLSAVFAWLGILSIIAVVRFQSAPDLVATIWAGMVLLLVAIAQVLGRRVFLHIGIALSFAVLVRGVLHNLYERSYFPWPGKSSPWMLVGGAVALILASLPFAFRLRRMTAENVSGVPRKILHWLDSRPEQLLFFLPLVLATIMLATEMRRGVLTVAWGIEAVSVFVFALQVKERSYRLAGLLLLLLCVGKIFVIDFWSLGIRDKALTGIIVGPALIAVSVLYTRKRDAIKQFL
jgi:hypothetical protein